MGEHRPGARPEIPLEIVTAAFDACSTYIQAAAEAFRAGYDARIALDRQLPPGWFYAYTIRADAQVFPGAKLDTPPE